MSSIDREDDYSNDTATAVEKGSLSATARHSWISLAAIQRYASFGTLVVVPICNWTSNGGATGTARVDYFNDNGPQFLNKRSK